MTRTSVVLAATLTVLGTTLALGQGAGQMNSKEFDGLEFRSIGPTLTTGRVADITVDPNRPDVYYVASAVGGLWKSENRGNTWKSVFDDGGSFNMCCVVVDPKDSKNVWLGTGENSNPRSSTYGDGLYKSTDGGDHFTRVGLAASEHIGRIQIDPRDSNIVWVAAQGPLWSAGGDRGIYKTTDGGKTWKAVYTVSENTGANDLVIDPNNPDVVYASMWERRRGVGQMIGGGPESAIVKTTDGGKTWTKLTNGLPTRDIGRVALGVDPKAKPTRVYALVNGLQGDSGFFRSDDAGANFHRMGAPYGKPGAPAGADDKQCDQPAGRRGGDPLPPGSGSPSRPEFTTDPLVRQPDGRAGQATPPAAPGRAGANGAGAAGQAGAPAPARGGRGGCEPGAYCGGDPGYYQEIFVDPVRPDTIWSANTNLEWTKDGGRCWSNVPNMGSVHVDFHSVWFDTKDPNHIMVGNDGGAYESFDEGKTWRHFDQLPVTQFYRVAVDDALPFYNVCGGAQDNESQCGPSRTINRVGIRMSDWWMTGGCDGFQSRMEPGNPNIVYNSCQSGGVTRIDLRTGETKGVQPTPGNTLPGQYTAPAAAEPAGAGGGAGGGRGGRGGGDRKNWDLPYIISPFSPTRLYYATDRLYRSDDRGDHWTAVSGDLTRNLNYDLIPIMGKVWDRSTTVAYNNATTPGSTIVSLDESPLAEGLIYVGTDDGLLQVTEDGGKSWRKTEHFEGVPDGVWLTDVFASPRDSNVVFVTLNNWQRGDYKPYIVRSDDRGKTFRNITGDLPKERTDLYTIAQDHVNGNLLFAGAEFGLFFTVDGGQHWTQLKGGLPTAQVRDIAIQRREDDLVLGTFSRSIYILDDYSPLREVSPESLAREAELYPLRHVYEFTPLGYPQAAWGNTTTPNPPVGATFTYSVGSGFSGQLAIDIANDAGKTVCRMNVPAAVGVERATWDLRVATPGGGGGRGGGGGQGRGDAGTPCIDPDAAPPAPPAGQQFGGGGFGRGAAAPMAALGHYSATIGKVDGKNFTPIGKTQRFEVIALPQKNW